MGTSMLSTSKLDLAFDNDDWNSSQMQPKHHKSSSVSSWGVTSFGRGFDWEDENDQPGKTETAQKEDSKAVEEKKASNGMADSSKVMRLVTNVTPTTTPTLLSATLTSEPIYMSPSHSRSPSPSHSINSSRPVSIRSPSTPRPRRRSSQQRVSLIAGRVSIAPKEPADVDPMIPPALHRVGSTSSFLSVASSTRAPSPASEESFLGDRSISDFHIEGEIGRGAYGLVKRGREKRADGSLGVSSVRLLPFLLIKFLLSAAPSH